MRRLLTDRFGEAGRTKPIIYTEMNGNRDQGTSDRDMLLAAARVCAADPHCLGYVYYIWETERDHERVFSVFGNDDRRALFENPPTFVPVEPTPPSDVLAVRRALQRIAGNTTLTPRQIREELLSLIDTIEV